ncbi:hypothetical protein MPSEU_000460700 [Mayamaea pseudoterrestris]|nr:hypothetical protein MPSEU_000460700 [Mayamaea pseudoterrestris]
MLMWLALAIVLALAMIALLRLLPRSSLLIIRVSPLFSHGRRPPKLSRKATRRLRRGLRRCFRPASTAPSAADLGYHRSFPVRLRRQDAHLHLPSVRQVRDAKVARNFAHQVEGFCNRLSRSPDEGGRARVAPPAKAKIKGQVSKTSQFKPQCGAHRSPQFKTKRRAPEPVSQSTPQRHRVHSTTRRPRPSSRPRPTRSNIRETLPSDRIQGISTGAYTHRPVGPTARQLALLQTYGHAYISSLSPGEQEALPDWVREGAQAYHEATSNLHKATGNVRRRRGKKERYRKVIWDSGASISLSFSKDDFVGPIHEAPESIELNGLFAGSFIKGYGHVAWSFEDSKGQLRTLKVPAYYVPSARVRLLSTNSLVSVYKDEYVHQDSEALYLSGTQGPRRPDGSPPLNSIRIPIDPQTNLPTGYAYETRMDSNAYNAQGPPPPPPGSGPGSSPGGPDSPLSNGNSSGPSSGRSPSSPSNRPSGSPSAPSPSPSPPAVAPTNMNLSEADKEILRWHYKFGHIDYRKIQFLMRSGALAPTEGARRLHSSCVRLRSFPMCAACQYAKQKVRSSPGLKESVVKDKADALRRDNLFPGQRISVDHFICSTKGRLFSSRGKSKETDLFGGGCIFVDHCTGYVHVELQRYLTTEETLKAKEAFELFCLESGAVPQEYLTDNGTAFTSKAFAKHLTTFHQIVKFAGTGSHCQNGVAERAIRTIMSIARAMLLHAAIHWPEVADPSLWPMAVRHAVYLWNKMPNPSTGISPQDLFTRTRWPHSRFHDLHVWGCPVYVLDKKLSDGHKLPRWQPRAHRCIFVGMSDSHASSVPLVLNPQTGSITPQYHVVFDDYFATVSSDPSSLPDLWSKEWFQLFGDSAYQYIPVGDETDSEAEAEEEAASTPIPSSFSRQERIRAAFDANHPSQALPVDVPPSSPRRPTDKPSDNPVANASPSAPPTEAPAQAPSPSPLEHPDASNPALTEIPFPSPSADPIDEPSQTRELPTFEPSDEPSSREPTPLPTQTEFPRETQTTASAPSSSPLPSALRRSGRLAGLQPQDAPAPRRSTRQVGWSSARYGYEGDQGFGYSAVNASASPLKPPSFADAAHFAGLFASLRIPAPAVYKAAATDPDTLSYEQAMADQPHVSKWLEAAAEEIRVLESKGTWEEVPKSQAKGRILPGTWVFRRKRTPDGSIKKYKGRYCVRGDLQEGVFETFAPVIAWSTIRVLLVIALTLDWHTCSVDFASAFVQAELQDPVWIHLPRGFRSSKGANMCLKLKKSLYGLAVAPRLWFEHLRDALLRMGLKQSKFDQCLFYGVNILFGCFVDDGCIVAKSVDVVTQFISKLQAMGFELTQEASLCEYLGIKLVRDNKAGSFTLTQQGLIDKIVAATGLQSCKPNYLPASQVALGSDPDGSPMVEKWGYASIVGMLLYLSTNTRPDIAFAVSQVARFNSSPKQSHAIAVKTIVRYLAGTRNQGTIFKPTRKLNLDLFVDADFCGLHKREPDHLPDSVRSRTGYVILLAGCPLVWKSQLQTEISLSTLEAEYSALSYSLKTLLPLKRILGEFVEVLSLPPEIKTSIRARVFEDNQGCYYLATNQKLTNRTKYFLVKYHWFWSHHNQGEFEVFKVDTKDQDADYMTKGLPRESFERNRLSVQGW